MRSFIRASFIFALTFSAAHAIELTIVSLAGSVSIKRGGETAWKAAAVKDKLVNSDSIRTAKGVVELTSQRPSATVRIAENTEVSLGSAAATKKNVDLRLAAGKAWMHLAKLAVHQSFNVETPNAIASVRGTTFVITFQKGASKLLTVEGTVDFGSGNTLVPVSGGFLAIVDENGNLIPPKKANDADISDMLGGIPSFDTPPPARRFDDRKQKLRGLIDRERSKLALTRSIASEKRTTDLMAGRVLTDMNGDVVRVEQLVRWIDSRTVNLISLTKRTTGVNAGLSYLDMTTRFNRDLPKTVGAAIAASSGNDLYVASSSTRVGERTPSGNSDIRYTQNAGNDKTFFYFNGSTTAYEGKMADLLNITPPASTGLLTTRQELQLWNPGQYGVGGQQAGKVIINASVISGSGQVLGGGTSSLFGLNDIFGMLRNSAGELAVSTLGGVLPAMAVDTMLIPDIFFSYVQRYW